MNFAVIPAIVARVQHNAIGFIVYVPNREKCDRMITLEKDMDDE